MARRRSSRKKSSSAGNPVIWIVTGVALVALFIVMRSMSGSDEKGRAGTDIPFDDLAAHASQLSNTSYVADGKIIDRYPRGSSELVAFEVKDDNGRDRIIPVRISAEVRKGQNINRGQQYTIEFEVKDLSRDVRGICIATSIKPK